MTDTSISLKDHTAIVGELNEAIKKLETEISAFKDESWVQTSWDSFSKDKYKAVLNADGEIGVPVKVTIGEGATIFGELTHIRPKSNPCGPIEHVAEIIPEGHNDGIKIIVGTLLFIAQDITFEPINTVKVYVRP